MNDCMTLSIDFGGAVSIVWSLCSFFTVTSICPVALGILVLQMMNHSMFIDLTYKLIGQ